MTSLLERPTTAASDDGVCRWHAAELWQTHAIKYKITEIKFDLHHKLQSSLGLKNKCVVSGNTAVKIRSVDRIFF